MQFVPPIGRQAPAASARVAPVVTVVEPGERKEIDRAGEGFFRTVHRESLEQVHDDLRKRRVSALLVSSTRCRDGDLIETTRVVREFPGIPALVLLNRHADAQPDRLLALGSCGVRRVVDVRAPAGWATLRTTLASDAVRENDAEAIARVHADLHGASPDMLKFFEYLFSGSCGPKSVAVLARDLGVRSSTLMSRFYRAGLPAPKRYVAFAGLLRAARLLENPGMSVSDVAAHLNHSSAQSFSRHTRNYLGVCAGEFRARYGSARMLDEFRARMITPFAATLKTLAPLQLRARRWHGVSSEAA